MAAEEKKVFDVAKPGESKPDIGSKPMIIGHKSLVSDPMVNPQDDKKVDDAKKTGTDSTNTGQSTASEKVIKPLSKDEVQENEPVKPTPEKQEKESVVEPENSTKNIVVDKKVDVPPTESEVDVTSSKAAEEETKSAEETSVAEDSKEIESQPEKEADKKPDDSKTDDKKEAKLDPVAVEMEREEKLRNLIDSKKYRLDIKEKKRSSTRSFLFALLLSLIFGCITLYLLMDSGILDLNYELPFRIIGE